MRHHHLTIVAIALLGAVLLAPAAVGAEEPALDPKNGTWHIGLDRLWGMDRDEGRRLDIYPVFLDGQWVNALATARRFNTSIHLIEESDVVVDVERRTVRGRIKVLITPDTWVPADGQPFYIEAVLDGQLRPQPDGGMQVGGTYTARRTDGEPLHGEEVTVQANLIGGVGRTETGWDNSVWDIPLNQVPTPGDIDRDLVVVRLGIAEGKVNWGLIGITTQGRWPVVRSYPIDVSGFGPVTEAGIAQGSVIVTGRHLHPGGDPDARLRLDVTARRVQGLAGGKAIITPLNAQGEPDGSGAIAAGRGTCSRGGGAGSGMGSVIWRHELNNDPWWVPVEGFRPIAAAEHPRLLFRRADLPQIRRRAATPEGQAIVARLRALLGGNGEELPTRFNPTPAHNHSRSPELPIGTFTTWHAAGYGMLYQLTGDRKYADMSRQCVEWMLEGKMDIDNRYGWAMPGTDLRCGSVLAAMAYAYDFCYDAWSEDFRRQIALEMQNFDKVTASSAEGAASRNEEPRSTDIRRLAGRTGYPPGSNHYGSLIGGTGVAMLAILGDPGVDDDFVRERIAEIESNIPRMLELGFGDGGWYAEGLPPSRLSTNGGLMELLHALRTAAGRDYIEAPRRNAQWLTLRYLMHLGGHGYANYPNRGVYGDDRFYDKGGLSGGGDFAFGFGAIAPQYRRALLWTYKAFVESGEIREDGVDGQGVFNAQKYPHRAIFSLLHWPIGEEPQNPAEVLPRVAVDRDHGYFIARNRWQDGDDIIVTHLLDYGPNGYYSIRDSRRGHERAGVLRVWGYGLRTTMTTGTGESSATFFRPSDDGSFSLTSTRQGRLTGLVVDFSGRSGAEMVIVAVGPEAGATGRDRPQSNDKASTQYFAHRLGELPVHIMTLQTGDAPEVRVEGDRVIHVGRQQYVWDGEKLLPRG